MFTRFKRTSAWSVKTFFIAATCILCFGADAFSQGTPPQAPPGVPPVITTFGHAGSPPNKLVVAGTHIPGRTVFIDFYLADGTKKGTFGIKIPTSGPFKGKYDASFTSSATLPPGQGQRI